MTQEETLKERLKIEKEKWLDEVCAFIENIKSHDYDYLNSDRWEGVCWTRIKTTELAKDLRKHMEKQQ